MHDDQFRIILKQFGLSWDGYRRVRKGVKKRINRHMQSCGCYTANAYMERLRQNSFFREECEQLLTVSISRFFRDRKLWAILESPLLPELINHQKNRIKVWSAGCACGEEVYSVKIVWDRIQKYTHAPKLEVFATDMNPKYLDHAVTGIYTQSSLKALNTGDILCYFTKGRGDNRYRVNDRLRTHIHWKQLDLRHDALAGQYNIIFLRNNILTYYLDPLKTNTFNRVVDCLAPSGILIIGAREVLPEATKSLEPIPPFKYVFRKISKNER